MIACSENESPDIAKMLVEQGALISVHDNKGKTPVFEAGKCFLIYVDKCSIIWGYHFGWLNFGTSKIFGFFNPQISPHMHMNILR